MTEDDALPARVLIGVLAAVALAGVMYGSPLAGRDPRVAGAYVLAAVFGALVGGTELSARYRDRPFAALLSWPAGLYMAVNAAASFVMVWLLFSRRLDLGLTVTGHVHPLLDALVIGAFAAMALFRSAVFSVQVGNTSVAVGPAAVLQEILRLADRQVDRLRAGPRALRVKAIMHGVIFARAREALPALCVGLMQNVDLTERDNLTQAINAIGTRTASDEAKAYSLGLLLMNLVGEEVLDKAVAGLDARIKGPAPDEPEVLGKASQCNPEHMPALLRICEALAPDLARDVVAVRRKQAGTPNYKLEDLLAPPPEPGIGARTRVIVALAQLRVAFGQEVVAEALRLLLPGQPATVIPQGTSVLDAKAEADKAMAQAKFGGGQGIQPPAETVQAAEAVKAGTDEATKTSAPDKQPVPVEKPAGGAGAQATQPPAVTGQPSNVGTPGTPGGQVPPAPGGPPGTETPNQPDDGAQR